MDRVYNFSAGPAALPTEVLEEAQRELLSYRGSGVSVMEMSKSSPEFSEILHDTEDALRALMNIPSNYKVLFLQGGATLQYSAIPLNLLSDHRCADYIVTGQCSKAAFTEAKNPQVSTVTIRSIVTNSDATRLSIMIAIPDIPPATRSKGTRNMAVPTDINTVPRTTKAIFLSADKSSFSDSLLFIYSPFG